MQRLAVYWLSLKVSRRWWRLPSTIKSNSRRSGVSFSLVSPDAQQHLQHSLEGIKVHYGPSREHRKTTANLHGRTHFNRTPGARHSSRKNDGRPPDTGKALLSRQKKSKPQALEYQKGYRWKDNSCWLDSSLTAVSAAVSRDFGRSMEPIFAALPSGHPLLNLRQMIHTRLAVELPGYEEGGCTVLSTQRDGFRKYLRDLPNSPLVSLTSFQTLFVSANSQLCPSSN